MRAQHLPRLDEIQDVWVLVDATIVHYNYRVWGGEWPHLIQGAFNEFVELFSVESTFDDVAVKDTFIEGQCRQYRIS